MYEKVGYYTLGGGSRMIADIVKEFVEYKRVTKNLEILFNEKLRLLVEFTSQF